MTLGASAEARPRILYVYAPTADDPALLRQRSLVEAAQSGMSDRDLVMIPVIGKRPRFEAVLVGKDGGEKLHSTTPLTPERLFETVDAMPMRRQEMRQR